MIMESDSTVITTSPIQSNDSMPPTPNSVENLSANSPTNHYSSQKTNKQIKREITVLTNNQPIMTSQSNRRRHYSSASSSADEDVDVVSESTKRNMGKHKKLNNSNNNNHQSDNRHDVTIKNESNSRSLNSSLNGSIEQTNMINVTSAANTILHSPNSNSSSNSHFDTTTLTSIKPDSAAALIANMDQASRKFKSFLIEDILSQQQKKQQQQFLLLQQQQLLLQQFNNSKFLQQQHSAVTLPTNASTTGSLSPNALANQSSPQSVHSLVNNNDALNEAAAMAAAANMAYNSLTNSIIRPWDFTNSLANSLTNGLIPNSAAAATLSQLTSAQAALNSQSGGVLSTTGLTPSSHSLALTLGTNVQTNTSPSQSTHHQTTNHLQNGSSLIQLNNQAAMAALAASQSSNNNSNKLNVQQLQQLSRFSGLNYPHFASSLSHLSAHHQFLAGLNGSAAAAGLFPSLANLTQQSAAAAAALKNDPAFKLHSLAHQFNTNGMQTIAGQQQPQQRSNTPNTDPNSMAHHLINSSVNSVTSNNSLLNGRMQTNNSGNHKSIISSNVNSKNAKQSINENGKRLNIEDLDDEYDNDTIMNDDDCDDKCSTNSSSKGATMMKTESGTAGTNGDDSSPLSALYELANKNFEMTRTEKNATEGNSDRMHSMFSNNAQNAKKKRKSRTAFTNKQIYELEKKFLLQKYLTPIDRDDLAEKLDLSGAQVITWFQNRRAKQKRDTDELSKDMNTATLLKAAHQMNNPYFYNRTLMETSLPNMNIYDNLQSIEMLKMAKMSALMPAVLAGTKNERN